MEKIGLTIGEVLEQVYERLATTLKGEMLESKTGKLYRFIYENFSPYGDCLSEISTFEKIMEIKANGGYFWLMLGRTEEEPYKTSETVSICFKDLRRLPNKEYLGIFFENGTHGLKLYNQLIEYFSWLGYTLFSDDVLICGHRGGYLHDDHRLKLNHIILMDKYVVQRSSYNPKYVIGGSPEFFIRDILWNEDFVGYLTEKILLHIADCCGTEIA